MLDLASSLLHFIVATLIPVTGLVLTAALLVYAVYDRFIPLTQKWVLTRRALQVLWAVAIACDVVLGLRLYLVKSAQQTWQDGAATRAARQRFVLAQDYTHGELLVPAGSLVNRNDPFDKGEPHRPVSLHGLEAVRFAQPVEVAGVWASALQVSPARVELAQDQRLGPIYRYDGAAQSWVVNKVVPALACKRGQVAVFEVPHIAYDVQAEIGKPAPDGPQARFAPSQWLLRNCEPGPAVRVEPAALPPVSPTAR